MLYPKKKRERERENEDEFYHTRPGFLSGACGFIYVPVRLYPVVQSDSSNIVIYNVFWQFVNSDVKFGRDMWTSWGEPNSAGYGVI